MDFPIFHLDWVGDRFLFVVIAITHVLVNHSLAVGLAPIVVSLEFLGIRKQNPEWDQLAYRILKTAFIITTTVGAMTGVGIWFSASLVNPSSIGSLIRVFFGAWFVEWIVFVAEVVLILFYYLTWTKWTTGRQKFRHFQVGYGLSVFSWITMAIIVSILGFMMDPGNWNTNHSFWSGFANPIYLPQLMFRTFLALIMGASVSMLLTHFYTARGSAIRQQAMRFLSGWILVCAPFALLGGVWYRSAIPAMMLKNMSVALGTQQFQQWYDMLAAILLAAGLFSVGFAAFHLLFPRIRYGVLAYITPVLLLFATLGLFERMREFVRKPYVIGGYMYSNTYRVDEYPLLKTDGLLKHATFVSTREVTSDNTIEAGRNVFMLACSRCHTANGVNAITDKFRTMYGTVDAPWDANAMKTYIRNMHNARYFMPPFPGNAPELDALVDYLKVLQYFPDPQTHLAGPGKPGISPAQNAAMLSAVKAKEAEHRRLANLQPAQSNHAQEKAQ